MGFTEKIRRARITRVGLFEYDHEDESTTIAHWTWNYDLPAQLPDLDGDADTNHCCGWTFEELERIATMYKTLGYWML